MSGPSFLYQSTDEMPLSRQFLDQEYQLPREELRVKKAFLYTTDVKVKLNPLFSLAEQVMSRTDKLTKAVGVLARLIKANFGQNRDLISETLTAADMDVAMQLLFLASMRPTLEAWKKSDLASLRPEMSGGIVYTAGRAGLALQQILGVDHLPILIQANSSSSSL